MVGSNDIARSKKFYDSLFVAMGGKPGVEDVIRCGCARAQRDCRRMKASPLHPISAGTAQLDSAVPLHQGARQLRWCGRLKLEATGGVNTRNPTVGASDKS